MVVRNDLSPSPLPVRPSFEASQASDALHKQGVQLDVRNLPPDVAAELKESGIGTDELEKIAGDDHVIATPAELTALFQRVAEAKPTDASNKIGSIDRAQSLYDKLQVRAASTPPSAPKMPAPTPPGYASSGLRTPPPKPLEPASPSAPAPAAPLTPADKSAQVAEAWTQIDALPARKSGPQPKHYVQAMEAHETKKKIDGVPAELKPLTVSLEQSKISSADVKQFMATGTLCDRLDDNGQLLESGEQRLAALEDAAAHKGSWPAENAIAYLSYARSSVLEGQISAGEAAGQDVTALAQNRKDLSAALLGVKRDATAARETHNGQALDRADSLRNKAREKEAAAATAPTDARKTALLKAAASARGEAERIEKQVTGLAEAESKYRKGMHGPGFDARRTLQVAARAQIATGAGKVEQLPKDASKLTAEPPAELGHGKDVNGQRGAGAILAESRELGGPKLLQDGPQHALEGARARAVGDFQQHAATIEEQAGKTPAQVAPRYTKLGQARVDESDAIDGERKALGPEPKGVDALSNSTLAGRQKEIWDGMGTVISKSQANVHLRGKVDELIEAQKGEIKTNEKKVAGAEKALVGAREKAADAGDDAQPFFGELFRNPQETKQAWTNLKDANTRVKEAEDGRDVARADVKQGQQNLKALEAQQKTLAPQSHEDAAGTALTKLLPATSEPAAYRYAEGRADQAAREQSAALDRANATLPPGDKKKYAGVIADQRLSLTRHYKTALENHDRASGSKIQDADQQARFSAGARENAAAKSSSTQLPNGPARNELAVKTVETGCELAVTGARHNAKLSNELFESAEDTSYTELHGNQRTAALELVGTASTLAYARSKEHLRDTANNKHWDTKANHELLERGKRLLPERSPTGSDARKAADDVLARQQGSGAALHTRLDASRAQLDAGQRNAEAEIRENAQAEAGLVKVVVDSGVDGPFWLRAIFEEVDHRNTGEPKQDTSYAGMVNKTANEKAARVIGFLDKDHRTLKSGADQLGHMYEQAKQAHEGDTFIDAVRIWSDPNVPRNSHAHAQALEVLQKYAPPTGPDQLDYQTFLRTAVQKNQVAAAGALGGSSLALGDDLADATSKKRAAATDDMAQAQDTSRRSFKSTADEFTPLAGISVGAQLALAYFTGRLMPSGSLLKAPGQIAAAGEAVKGVEAGAAAQGAIKAGRLANAGGRIARAAANPTVRAVGSHLAIAGGSVLANKAIDGAVGKDTNAGRGMKAVVNMAPLVAAPHAAGVAAEAEQALSTADKARAAVKGLALVGGIGAAQHLAPAVAEKLGIRDPMAQEALGVAFGAVLVGGVAASARAGGAKVRPEGFSEHVLGNKPNAQRAVAERTIQEFVKSSEGRVPSEAEVSAFKTKLASQLGGEGKPLPKDVSARLDSTVEALRIQRSLEVAVNAAQASEPGKPKANVIDRATENLAQARGPKASAPQALLDVHEFAARYGTPEIRQQAQSALSQAGTLPPPAPPVPPPPRPAQQVTQEWHQLTPQDRQLRFSAAFPSNGNINQLSPTQLQRAFGDGPFGQYASELLSVPGVLDMAKAEPDRAAMLYRKWITFRNEPYTTAPLTAPLTTVAPPLPNNASQLESMLDASLPNMVSMGKRGMQFHAALSKNGAVHEPAVRIGPDRARDGSGAMHLHEEVLNPVTGKVELGSLMGSAANPLGVPRIRSSFALDQIQLPPGTQPVMWNEVMINNNHGHTHGFAGMSNQETAVMVVDSAELYEASKAKGAPRPKYVILDACDQGTLRNGGTNAKDMQAALDAETSRRNLPRIIVLAVNEGGVTYTGGDVPRPHVKGDLRADNVDTVKGTLVTADQQSGGVDPDALRKNERNAISPSGMSPSAKATVAAAGAVIAVSAAGGTYMIVSNALAKGNDDKKAPPLPEPRRPAGLRPASNGR